MLDSARCGSVINTRREGDQAVHERQVDTDVKTTLKSCSMNTTSDTRSLLLLAEAQRIAESIVGTVQWHGAEGYCRCPGEGLHTTRTTSTDCKVVCEPVPKEGGVLKPGCYCFHDKCRGAQDNASHQLRSALGKRCPGPRREVPRVIVAAKREPKFNPEKLARLAAKLPGISDEWFAERSPIRADNRTPASFLQSLYAPGESVIVFDVYDSQGQHVWKSKKPPFNARELDPFRTGKPNGVWYLGNPVDGEFRENDQKKWSRRSRQNVTNWRYMVLESDEADAAHWLGALGQMPLKIAAIYTSGGRSIHALVRLDAVSKAHWDEICNAMKPTLVTLGADSGALSAVRLTRLPCCERAGTTDRQGQYIPHPTPRQQRLLYLNPRPSATPICELPVK